MMPSSNQEPERPSRQALARASHIRKNPRPAKRHAPPPRQRGGVWPEHLPDSSSRPSVGRITATTNGTDASTKADEVLVLTGPAVLLDVADGTKRPVAKAWQELTLPDMTPGYLAGLRRNIGVSLGAASGGLYTVDCDSDEAFQEFLANNPRLKDTLQSHGTRGGNFWMRIGGDVPPSGKLKKQDGSEVGEWRGDGNQTIIHGTHPSGEKYRNNAKEVVTLQFAEIVWPQSWKLPWEKSAERGGVEPPRNNLRKTRPAHAATAEVVECMLSCIPPRPDRDTWMKISAAARNSLGDDAAAIELLKSWSPEEKEGEYAELLSSCPFEDITFGTLVHHAELHGFSGVVGRFFYDGKKFFMRGRSEFIPLSSEGAVKQHLKMLGVSKQHHDRLLCRIREEQYMHHVGPVAGRRAGLHRFEDTRALVTTGPKIIPAVEGRCEFLTTFFSTLLGDENYPHQHEYFLDWLAHCRRTLLDERRNQTPAVAFAGPVGSGKTLGISIVNKCLGGRSARAYQFMAGDTHFNADVVGAELLVVDDDAVSKDHRARVRLAQSLKATLFSDSVRMEAKHANAFSLDPIQAVIFAVNDDPEHIRVLPELDASMDDKICLFKTSVGHIPAGLIGNMELIRAAVDEDLPGFLFQLESRDLNNAYNDRGRLRCFWHPEIVGAVESLSPEEQMRQLIYDTPEILMAISEQGYWEGRAAALQGLLACPSCTHQTAARPLLSWPGACGTYLGRLANTPNSGVTRARLDASRTQLYRIDGGGGGSLTGCAEEEGEECF
jgi:hypothetical protein